HIGLVHEPSVADRPSPWPGRIREQWCEALQPSIDRDVIDLDPTLAEDFLDVALGEPVPQIPAHSENDDLGREPEPAQGRAGDRGYQIRRARPHPSPPTATAGQRNSACHAAIANSPVAGTRGVRVQVTPPAPNVCAPRWADGVDPGTPWNGTRGTSSRAT